MNGGRKKAERGPPHGIKELTIDDMLLAHLRLAEDGLRRNSIDETEDLIDFCQSLRAIPRERWWPRDAVRRQVEQFFRHHFKRVGNRLQFKRPAHRMRSLQGAWDRFCRNPSSIAAELVRSEIAADRRHRRPGKPKQRLQRVVDQINAHPSFRNLPIEEKASVEVVRELLRRGRGKRPADPFDDDPNGPT